MLVSTLHYLVLSSQKYQANVDKNTVVTNNLISPIRANWIRLHPRSWSSCIAMRLEFYGY